MNYWNLVPILALVAIFVYSFSRSFRKAPVADFSSEAWFWASVIALMGAVGYLGTWMG